MSFNQLWWW